jgi:hypothetical protein
MTALVQAARALARRPAFTLVAVVTLAASAGVTATVFSIVNSVLWKPLPYPGAGQLVAVYEANPGQQQRVSLIAPVRLDDWRRLNRTFRVATPTASPTRAGSSRSGCKDAASRQAISRCSRWLRLLGAPSPPTRNATAAPPPW